MHPILAKRERLLLYLALWIAFGLLLAMVISVGAHLPFQSCMVFTLPLALLLGFLSLPYWYLVRVLPADSTPLPRLAGTWLGVGFVSLAIWIAAAIGWRSLLMRMHAGYWPSWDAGPMSVLMLFSGASPLLVSLLLHYTL